MANSYLSVVCSFAALLQGIFNEIHSNMFNADEERNVLIYGSLRSNEIWSVRALRSVAMTCYLQHSNYGFTGLMQRTCSYDKIQNTSLTVTGSPFCVI